MLLSQKANEAEQEITRMRLNAMKTEEEKILLERKTREAEMLTARLVEESERRAAEAARLKDELLRARVAEKQAKEKLLDFLSRNACLSPTPTPNMTQVIPSYLPPLTSQYSTPLSSHLSNPELQGLQETSISPVSPELTSYDLIANADVEQLSLEIEKER